jgi:hypothetical protein
MRLRKAFDRMRKYNLKSEPDKCEFLRKEVSYLGHVGQTGGGLMKEEQML